MLFTTMARKGKAAMNTNVESNVSYFIVVCLFICLTCDDGNTIVLYTTCRLDSGTGLTRRPLSA